MNLLCLLSCISCEFLVLLAGKTRPLSDITVPGISCLANKDLRELITAVLVMLIGQENAIYRESKSAMTK